ncbi:Rrf2 family transcriptional regulator [Streptomyces tubbatahanensis]|uniref:Rrf2 family transcriptional regulator n=1 Tax=Streptomyces tubbatahanensis TaxID=2923272 RepID=A0ABY3Y0I4_9ACTN|nr:Rrf2 family transcriptional regulator [Streptomyces tubbatahanensis]UNS99768.1 Rrf2 family transcriptional regulator [Streptomyces tubbatahanensis]
MRLAKSTDLALRVVMRLAVAGDELCVARQVADDMAVPYSHLAKVVNRLQRLGVVETWRGRGGGLALTGAGRTASVGWLAREFEGAGDVVECEGDDPCPLHRACRLRAALRSAQEAFFATLDPLTVSDLVQSPTGPVLLGMVGRGPGGAAG